MSHDIESTDRLYFLDNIRTAMIFLVVLVHAGTVYESSGGSAFWWIVDDPATNDIAGLVNLVVDVFGLSAFFFVSGYLAPMSLKRHDGWRFLAHRFRRLMVPWLIAVFTLLPLFKVIFLYSRGLPQEHWATYFHFSNGIFSQSWLWFLPVLFLFDAVFWLSARLKLRAPRMGLWPAVLVAMVVGVAYSFAVTRLGHSGWTKTPLLDFQNEKLLTYFMVFLIGALAARNRVFDREPSGKGLYWVASATAWFPITVYTIVLLNLLFAPGQYFVSLDVDLLVMWVAFYLSLLAMVYLTVQTFRYWWNRAGPTVRELNANAYGVYVIHVIVLGVIALGLLHTGLPSMAKYGILTVTTWLGANLLVWGYRKGLKPVLRTAASTGAP